MQAHDTGNWFAWGFFPIRLHSHCWKPSDRLRITGIIVLHQGSLTWQGNTSYSENSLSRVFALGRLYSRWESPCLPKIPVEADHLPAIIHRDIRAATATVPRGGAAALCGPGSLSVRWQRADRRRQGISACSIGYSLLCWHGRSAWLLSLVLLLLLPYNRYFPPAP